MKYLVAALAACFILASCSDDNETTTYPNFMPVNAGNYWTYSNYSISGDDGTETKLTQTDSLAYIKDTTYLGKAAQKYEMISWDNTYKMPVTHDIYMYEENNQLFVSSSFIELFLNLVPIEIPAQWMKIADRTASQWNLTPIQVSDIAITIPVPVAGDVSVTLSGTLNMSIKNNGKQSIEVPAGAYNAANFVFEISFNGKVATPLLPTPIDITNLTFAKINYGFADGIGLINITSEPLSLQIITGMPAVNVDGVAKKLEKFKTN